MSRAQLALLKRIIAAGATTIELPLEKVRSNFETFLARFPGLTELEVEKVEIGGRPAEWLWVGPERPVDAVLFFHGGGFVTGSLLSHRQLAGRLAQAACARVLHLDYRLAPEFPFPAALDDALAAYRSLLDLGHDPRRLGLAGDSAGAGLAVLVATRIRDAGWALPRALIALSPWIDFRGAGSLERHAELDPLVRRPGLEKMAAQYLGKHSPDDPAISLTTADLKGLPPLLIQAGGDEALIDDALLLEQRATAAGVEVKLEIWPGMIHVWHLFASRLTEGEEAIAAAGRFFVSRG
jgi:epsilon-lactone hydrolase